MASGSDSETTWSIGSYCWDDNGDSRSSTPSIPTEQKSEDDDSEHAFKKFKADESQSSKTINSIEGKCDICGQYETSLICYEGHPEDAVDEEEATTDARLIIKSYDDKTEKFYIKITRFNIYDQQSHLVPIDGGLIESGGMIYLSGYLSPIRSKLSEAEEQYVPTRDIGPISQWNIQLLEGRTCITLSTEYGDYFLINPSQQYKPLMDNMYEKIGISRIVVEFLQENAYLHPPTYEELLERIRARTVPELDATPIDENMLHKHAQFVCDEIVDLNKGGYLKHAKNKVDLITFPCMRQLIKLMGINVGKRETRSKINYKNIHIKILSKATTTRLVRKTLKRLISDKLDVTKGERFLTTELCRACQTPLPPVGQCNPCNIYEADPNAPHINRCVTVPVMLTAPKLDWIYRQFEWIGEFVKADKDKVFYEKVKMYNKEINKGDFVELQPSHPALPSQVGRVAYMWHEASHPEQGFIHAEVFIRATDTLLGKVADPREVFLADMCGTPIPISSIFKKVTVEKKDTPARWSHLGGKEVEEEEESYVADFFYNKYYETSTARFEDLPKDPTCPNQIRQHMFCPSCERNGMKSNKNIPKVVDMLAEKSDIVDDRKTEWALVKWRDNEYKKGCGVFLKPSAFMLPNYLNNIKTGKPFCVGHIAAITAAGQGPLIAPQDIYLIVNIMYRPENINDQYYHHEDLNFVYWSDQVKEVRFSDVTGPCHLVYEQNIPSRDWLEKDLSRFYFRSAYDNATGKIVDVPNHAINVGGLALAAESTECVRPLRALNVFAGCGGLAAGLHRAGVAHCRWAVEVDEAAAHAYSLNNKDCIVFEEDCNSLLRDAKAGAKRSPAGLRLPQRGDVELLCGGPPSQVFNDTNSFNWRDYCNFWESLVVSYLSYCEYYRPKYIILENVYKFAAFKQGMVLKLTLRALLDMGYQCTVGVLQAGSYGVPQSRRHLFVLAAAPGFTLPQYPEPTHSFQRLACSKAVLVPGLSEFATNVHWKHSAPRRACTVRDAISDLPPVANCAEVEYSSMAESHFQRQARGCGDGTLRDHVAKNMSPLVQTRIAHVPAALGSDWRDLPNVSVELSNGTVCNVLRIRHEHVRRGLASPRSLRKRRASPRSLRKKRASPRSLRKGCASPRSLRKGRASLHSLRGVCSCAAGRPCSPHDRQDNTLIPWGLAHTAHKHFNWPGLYGRLHWDGYFKAVLTDPEPMGTTGRVLHPEEARVVSVRECARAQGFPDSHIFAGSLIGKYRQVGSAVPPPLGAALGREIKKALIASKTEKLTTDK